MDYKIMESITSPDMGMVDLEPGTVLLYRGCKPDEMPKRQGWYWYEFDVIGKPV